MKVDFIIIGAQKSATTTLGNIFRSHPHVSFCKQKEPNYFNRQKNWSEHLDQYHSLFEQKENCIYGEGSVSYSMYPHYDVKLWEVLHEYNPNMKFIYLVRKPIDRIISAYMHSFERGYQKGTIEEEMQTSNYNYFTDVTKYFFQISPFIEKFGRDKVLIFDFDDFNKNRNDAVKKVADFLSLDFNLFSDFGANHKNASVGGKKTHRTNDKYIGALKSAGKIFPKSFRQFIFNKLFVRNSFSAKPKLSVETQRRILNDLENDIQQLEKLMNKDFSQWRIINEN